MFQFRRLQTRILFFFLGLLITLLGVIFYYVDSANIRNARFHINEALALTVGTFDASLENRRQRLLEKVRLLSSDFAFKQAFATGDHDTILSALENHQSRVGANIMMLIGFEDNQTIANTLVTKNDADISLQHVINTAYNSESGEAASIELIDEQVYQLVVVPLFAPHPVAWIVIGFTVDNIFANQIKEATKTEVSLAKRKNGQLAIFSSTLSDSIKEKLESTSLTKFTADNKTRALALNSEEYLLLVASLQKSTQKSTQKSKQKNPESQLIAILQRSMTKALAPYLALRKWFIGIFTIGLILAVTGGIAVAKSITKPVTHLVAGANRIREGNYSVPVKITHKDELGHLANSINQAMRGLADRKHIRSLLGKVVSPAIAEELLSKDIELGGEEREVTILFSDVRSFTSFCEHHSPKEILSLLNVYLTRISEVIDKHNGVVDKYIGDAVMALFGAPLRSDKDPENAVLAALAMQSSLLELNKEFAKSNQPQLAMGIGINTGKVVAGNMGSETRLNYTVIGDDVNLASRLEGVTKNYGVNIIVSESTQLACPKVEFLELDRIRVKGKAQPVNIYQPLWQKDLIHAKGHVSLELELLQQYNQALQLYRQQQWQDAVALFEVIAAQRSDWQLIQLYLQRLHTYSLHPPGPDWDGTTNFETK